MAAAGPTSLGNKHLAIFESVWQGAVGHAREVDHSHVSAGIGMVEKARWPLVPQLALRQTLGVVAKPAAGSVALRAIRK